MSDRGVSELISFVLIAVMTIGLVGTALTWGLPLITKQQDESKLQRLHNVFNEDNHNSIVYKIGQVAKNGGKETFTSEMSGIWVLHPDGSGPEENSIEFMMSGKVSNVIVSDESSPIWSSFTSGSGCPPDDGVVGLDNPMVICSKSHAAGTGFDITYRAWSRVLEDPSGTRGYKILLLKNPNGPASSTGRTVLIERKNTYTCQKGQPACPDITLIITEVEILLV